MLVNVSPRQLLSAALPIRPERPEFELRRAAQLQRRRAFANRAPRSLSRAWLPRGYGRPTASRCVRAPSVIFACAERFGNPSLSDASVIGDSHLSGFARFEGFRDETCYRKPLPNSRTQTASKRQFGFEGSSKLAFRFDPPLSRRRRLQTTSTSTSTLISFFLSTPARGRRV